MEVEKEVGVVLVLAGHSSRQCQLSKISVKSGAVRLEDPNSNERRRLDDEIEHTYMYINRVSCEPVNYFTSGLTEKFFR
jgi:hypothetical protein